MFFLVKRQGIDIKLWNNFSEKVMTNINYQVIIENLRKLVRKTRKDAAERVLYPVKPHSH